MTHAEIVGTLEATIHGSFVVYIDEAGDEGFVFQPDRRGSSRWFILAAAVTRRSVDLETVKLVDSLRATFNWSRRPLHFRNLKHEHRVPYIDLIAKARIRVVAVAVHKESIQEP